MADTPGRWQPILDGDAGVRARRIILEIASDLPRPDASDDCSLSAGHAGFALTFAYLGVVLGRRDGWDRAWAHIDRAVDLIQRTPLKPRMWGGFVGVAWAVQHLISLDEPRAPGAGAGATMEGGAGDREDDDVSTEIDEALIHHLSGPMPCEGRLDFAKGIVGVGAYALERRNARGDELLERVVDRFAATACPVAGGVTWPMLEPSVEASVHGSVSGAYERRPDPRRPRTNLGMLHGVGGVIAVLAQACRLPSRREVARQLLGEAAGWLLSQARAPGPSGRFSCFAPSIDRGTARAAWCYGDLGIGAALLAASHALRDQEIRQQAIATLRGVAGRSPADTGAMDACLCHGSAGLAHVLNRAYQVTGDDALAAAARDWLEITMARQTPGRGVGGFEMLVPEARPGKLPHATRNRGMPGFLWGACGVALALLAAIGSTPADWDAALLVSLPPGSLVASVHGST